MPTMTNEDLNVALVRLEGRMEALTSDIHEIKEALVGNGSRPGIVERMTVAEQRIIGVESRLTSIEARGEDRTKLSWKAITALIALATTLAGIVSALVTHTGGTPPGH